MNFKIFLLTLPFLSFQDIPDFGKEGLIASSNSVELFLENLYQNKKINMLLNADEAIDATISYLNNYSFFQQHQNKSNYIDPFLNNFKNFKIINFKPENLEKLTTFISEQNQLLSKYPDNLLWINDLLTLHRHIISELFLNSPSKIFELIEKQDVSIFSFLNEKSANEFCSLTDGIKLNSESLVKFGSRQVIENIFRNVSSAKKEEIFSHLLSTYHKSEKSRECFKRLVGETPKETLLRCLILFKERKLPQLAQILFAHLNTSNKNFITQALKSKNIRFPTPLPGRLGSTDVFMVKLGNAEMYFFMDLEKYDLALKMENQVDKNLMCSIDAAEFPLPTVEVAATATMFRKPLGFDKDLNPINIDPLGTLLIDDYTQKVVDNFKKRFDCSISTLTREMNLVISHDAMRFHRDQLPLQYAFLNKAGNDFPKCFLAQDLTLMDWDMPKNSFSGTLMRDGDDGDIFFILQFPNEVTANFTLDPPRYPSDGSPPVYPGPTTLPYHSPYAPVDYNGKFTSGSEKGKRVSSVVRGIILDQDLSKLRSSAIPLKLNKRSKKQKGDGSCVVTYENGIEIGSISETLFHDLSINNLVQEANDQHIQLLSARNFLKDKYSKLLKATLGKNLDNFDLSFYKLIKRTSGFTRLADLDLNIGNEDLCLIINRSQLPENYEYTQISEDCTSYGSPWVHMYFLPKMHIMKLTGKMLANLCLTPIEEMFFRNPKYDADNIDVEPLHSDFHSEIDLFILHKKNNENSKIIL